MYIISQNLKEMLKERIKNTLIEKVSESVEELVENLLDTKNNTKYFEITSKLEQTTKNIIKDILVVTIEEFDASFRNSAERKTRYYVNKSNVSRTIVTIFGTITFNRTYYINRVSKTKMFYIDNLLGLTKYDHFDSVVKAIAIERATNSSQAESSRVSSNIIDGITSFTTQANLPTISRQCVYNWIKTWNVPTVVPTSLETPETLYVMADEKFIGCQDLENDIMVKCFVTFEGIKKVSVR